MKSKREIKPVSFNVEDPFEVRLLEHALKQKFFSKYIKRLIQRDLEGLPASQPVKEVVSEEVPETMSSFF